MKDKINAILPTLRAAFSGVLFLLRLTTYFVLGILTWNFFQGKTFPAMAWAMTAVLTYLGGYVIDGLLDKLLPFAATQEEAYGKEKTFQIIVRIIAVVLLIITGTLSWWAMPEVANVAIRENDNSAEIATIQQVTTDARATIEAKAAEVKEAQRSERARVRQAEREGRRIVSEAIATGPQRWQELYREKNTWFAKQGGDIRRYRQRIAEAEAKAAALIDQEKNLVRMLRSEKSEIELNRTAKADSIATTLAAVVEKRETRREARLDNLTNILFIMDIAWMVLAGALAFLIGLVNGHDLSPKKSAIGLMFEIGTHAEQATLSAVEWRLLKSGRQVPPTGSELVGGQVSSPTGSGRQVPPTGGRQIPPSELVGASSPAPAPAIPAEDLETLESKRREADLARQVEEARQEADRLREEAERHARQEAEARRQETESAAEEKEKQESAIRAAVIAADEARARQKNLSADKKPKPLSDKDSNLSADKNAELVGQVVGDTISVGEETWADWSAFVEAARKWYTRQFPKSKDHPAGSARPGTQATNRAKWEAARPLLETRYTLEYIGYIVSMTPVEEYAPHRG